MSEPTRAESSLASRAVTLGFTDVEGSTRLWEEEPERMKPALRRHDAISRAAVESHGGLLVKSTGDGVHAAFDNALDALGAAVDLQQAMADPTATNGVPLHVRCGLHAGVVERRDNDYFGSPVNRAARIMSVAHGGQVLLSQAVADCVRDLPCSRYRCAIWQGPAEGPLDPRTRLPSHTSATAAGVSVHCARWRPRRTTCRSRRRASLGASKHWRSCGGCWPRPAS